MSSDRFPAYHTTDKKIATLDYTSGQTVTKSLQLQNRYNFVTGCLTLSMTGGGAAPVSAVQEAALGIIQRMYVTVNGAQQAKHETSGRQLFLNTIEATRKAPKGFEPLTSATKTYKVFFQWQFAPANIRQRDIFALDLLKEKNNASLLSNAEVSVDWGTASSLWHSAGGMTVASAQLELWGNQTMLPVGNPANPFTYSRANETIVRKITTPYVAGSTSVEVEIPSVSGAFLVGLTVAQFARKAANDFADESAILSLKNDEYEWKSAPIGVMRSRQNQFLDDTPNNVIFINLIENNNVDTALPDGAFTNNLDITIPVNDGASTDAMTVEVYATFVTRGTVK